MTLTAHVWIKAQAEQYADERSRELVVAWMNEIREAMSSELRSAYMAGAEAGFAAARSEERKP